ncbi:MAG: hypothetical protein ACRCW1_06065 [Anaerotignaceae bacterium]
MKQLFSAAQKASELNKIYIEDDDVLIHGEYLEGEGKLYILTGSALIEGETYHDFKIEFELLEEPEEEDLETIMNMEWDWYDYV